MKPAAELINKKNPGIAAIKEILGDAENQYELLEPSDKREKVLFDLQLPTSSSLGAMAYDTGGLLINKGFVRFLGSGNPKMRRDIVSWNKGRADGFYLIADDIFGGFFALNAGELGDDMGGIYYLAPEEIDWEPLEVTFSEFLDWTLAKEFDEFYEELKWDGWEKDCAKIKSDEAILFYPFLWGEDGDLETSTKKAVPIKDIYEIKMALED